MKLKYDVIVIGSGPGGYVAAIRAAELGLRTACIEKEKTLGGTCLNVGCIPSKALLFSSERYSWIQHHAEENGILLDNLSVNFKQMMERKEKIVSGLVQGVATLFKLHSVDSIQGTATLISPHQIAVEDQQLEAEHIILATGSVPIELPSLPFDEQFILSSTGALSLSKVPKSLIVIGAGVIGVELASVYNRLGSKVIVVEMLDHICPPMDESVRKELEKVLKRQGIEFLLGTQVVKGEKKGKRMFLKTTKEELFADQVLVAVGRRPNTYGLGLENIGLSADNRGTLEVDSEFRVKGQPHIFAIGDLIDGPMLAHKASCEGIAVAEIIGGVKTQVHYMSIPNVIYTNPEVGAVGLTEEEIKNTGRSYTKGISYFKGNPRGRCTGETEGFVKVLADKETQRLLGMHIVCHNASEMIGEGVLALEKGATIREIAYASHAHPTFSETIREACLNAL